jgi:ribosome-associated translation inhibitor RaiA
MRIEVKAKGIRAADVDEHVRRRLMFAVGRFGDRVRSARVRLADVNGPKGGEDKRCRIELDMRPGGRVFAESVEPDWQAAVDLAADRAGRSVSRAFERRRAFRFESGMVPRKGDWFS